MRYPLPRFNARTAAGAVEFCACFFWQIEFIVRMTIWILALVLMAASAALGHRQGAIRAVISLAGILISALLAWPLSGLLRPLLPHIGFHNPIVVWMLPPLIVFAILLSVFKSVGFAAHRKVEVRYRYGQDELRFLLWQRLNHWLGLCVGLVNGLVYLILLSPIIYDLSYWTTQVASSDNEKLTIKLLNRVGQDLQATGMNGVACAINPLPQIYFKAADLAGLLYQNPQLSGRLEEYPPFLSLAERDDFKQLGQDADFQIAWKKHAPLDQIMDNSQF
ncbi:MAG TPA: CvpA family protein, partial [Candidatus Saccharimonadales bacterium]|nr:CvpA family protein [Candidatus Saccharimonadales bacterium]